MHIVRMTAAAGAAIAMMLSGAAAAQSASYRVDANATFTAALNVCSPVMMLEVRGDGDTDLDFEVYNSSGVMVHSDYDTTDITFATLNRAAGVNCENFDLKIQNLGDVYNQAEVTLTQASSRQFLIAVSGAPSPGMKGIEISHHDMFLKT